MSKKYAFYSAEAEKQYGSNVWRTPEGKEVLITAILESEDSVYNWPDKVYVGEVTDWVRAGVKGENQYQEEALRRSGMGKSAYYEREGRRHSYAYVYKDHSTMFDYYGFYSRECELTAGLSYLYENDKGQVVDVTHVSCNPDFTSYWPDLVPVGKLSSFVRPYYPVRNHRLCSHGPVKLENLNAADQKEERARHEAGHCMLVVFSRFKNVKLQDLGFVTELYDRLEDEEVVE